MTVTKTSPVNSLRQCGPTPTLDHSVMDDPVLIAELSNPALLAADNSNDVAVFTATLMHPRTHGRGPLLFIKRGRQQLFLDQDHDLTRAAPQSD